MKNEHGTLSGIKRDGTYKERLKFAQEEVLKVIPSLKDGNFEKVHIFYWHYNLNDLLYKNEQSE